MAFGYPPYPGIYQPQIYPQMGQPQNQMMQGPQQLPVQNQTVQPPQIIPQNSGINWVQSKLEADNWPVLPGSAVALWDSNNPVIYLRQADSTGKPSTKVYDLVERTNEQPAQGQTPQIDFTQFITRDQLEDILAERLKRPSRATKPKEDTDNG